MPGGFRGGEWNNSKYETPSCLLEDLFVARTDERVCEMKRHIIRTPFSSSPESESEGILYEIHFAATQRQRVQCRHKREGGVHAQLQCGRHGMAAGRDDHGDSWHAQVRNELVQRTPFGYLVVIPNRSHDRGIFQ